MCNYEESGTCKFTSNCWYRHKQEKENHDEVSLDKNENIIQKLFDMVEHMSKRLIYIENQM